MTFTVLGILAMMSGLSVQSYVVGVSFLKILYVRFINFSIIKKVTNIDLFRRIVWNRRLPIVRDRQLKTILSENQRIPYFNLVANLICGNYHSTTITDFPIIPNPTTLEAWCGTNPAMSSRKEQPRMRHIGPMLVLWRLYCTLHGSVIMFLPKCSAELLN